MEKKGYSLCGQFQVVAFLDFGLPFLIKSKNVIRVRHKHWPYVTLGGGVGELFIPPVEYVRSIYVIKTYSYCTTVWVD